METYKLNIDAKKIKGRLIIIFNIGAQIIIKKTVHKMDFRNTLTVHLQYNKGVLKFL